MVRRTEDRTSRRRKAHHAPGGKKEAGAQMGFDQGLSRLPGFFGIHPPRGTGSRTGFPAADQQPDRERRQERQGTVFPARGFSVMARSSEREAGYRLRISQGERKSAQ